MQLIVLNAIAFCTLRLLYATAADPFRAPPPHLADQETSRTELQRAAVLRTSLHNNGLLNTGIFSLET